MAETTTKELSMTFKCTDGSTENLNVPDYRDDVTESEIRNGMLGIIDAKIFAPKGLFYDQIYSAKKIVKTTTDVILPPTE